MIDGENSPLPLLHFDAQHGWSDLLTLAGPFLDPSGLQRLQTCLAQSVKAVLVERHYIDKDYRDTFSNFHSKRFSTPDSRCIRVHFLDTALDRVAVRDSTQLQAAYCGYAVIRPTRPNSIGRTLIDPRKLPTAKGTMRLCEESVCLQTALVRTSGFPFLSQDADVTVCAQSALWMLLRFFSNRYKIYREIYPHQITQLTRDYSIGRLVPTGGLTNWQMSEALRQLGFSPLIYSAHDYGVKFHHLLYTYVESGIPVLAATRDHVVVVFGHYSDYAKPVPAGSLLTQSSFFNNGFIINDDNRFPYQRLQETPEAAAEFSQIGLNAIEAFTVALPEKVFLAAEQFEELAEVLVRQSPEFGVAKWSPSLKGQQVVTRVFLTTGKSFKRGLDVRGMGSSVVRDVYRNLPLPHFIWVCEISTVDPYRQHKILGEVLWDATRNACEPNGWLALHYPERLFIDHGSAFNLRSRVIDIEITDSHSYPLMIHNLEHL